LEIQRIIRRAGERRELASRLKTIILGGMAKKAAAQNGRADLPVSQDAWQHVCDWHASHYVKVMLDQK
jgi:hypothetical protein